jgi:hypothetical protein
MAGLGDSLDPSEFDRCLDNHLGSFVLDSDP